MPSAPLRPCLETGCPHLVTSGRCPEHARLRDARRGTASQRGYGHAWRTRFRPQFIDRLVLAGIAPVCGAKLPTGPQGSRSRCQAEGLLTFTSADGSSLHVNHEPPLTDDERRDPMKVQDENRTELLCAACHGALTASQG